MDASCLKLCKILSIIQHFFIFSWQLQFIRSEFKGQLPKPYSSKADATKIIPSDMNDLNKEEPSRYVSVKLFTYPYLYG